MSDEEILKYFTRKTIKKTVMTNPYSATYMTAFDYFNEEVEKIFDIKFEYGSEEEKYFKKFYNFVDKEVELSIF